VFEKKIKRKISQLKEIDTETASEKSNKLRYERWRGQRCDYEAGRHFQHSFL
jgi:hypothetical protein